MNVRRKEALALSLFVFLALVDVGLRFFWLARRDWTCNPGVFWGIELSPVLLWLGIISIFAWCLWLFVRSWETLLRVALAAILIGAAVNIIDRLMHGCVLDYLSWPLGLSAFFPNFNLSDSLILFGLCILFSWLVFTKVNKEENTEY